MKTKVSTLFLLISVLFSSCTRQKYLPNSKEIDVNQYGSYIEVYPLNETSVKGELISIDKVELMVLTKQDEKSILKTIPIGRGLKFKLRYARGKRYGWTIPTYTALSFMHGWAAMFSLPVNLAVTILITNSGAQAFTYKNEDIRFEELQMFARFPGGIPEYIDRDKIQ